MTSQIMQEIMQTSEILSIDIYDAGLSMSNVKGLKHLYEQWIIVNILEKEIEKEKKSHTCWSNASCSVTSKTLRRFGAKVW